MIFRFETLHTRNPHAHILYPYNYKRMSPAIERMTTFISEINSETRKQLAREPNQVSLGRKFKKNLRYGN